MDFGPFSFTLGMHRVQVWNSMKPASINLLFVPPPGNHPLKSKDPPTASRSCFFSNQFSGFRHHVGSKYHKRERMRGEISGLRSGIYPLSQWIGRCHTSRDGRRADARARCHGDTAVHLAGTRPPDPCPPSPGENGKCTEIITRRGEIRALTWEISGFGRSGNGDFVLGDGWGWISGRRRRLAGPSNPHFARRFVRNRHPRRTELPWQRQCAPRAKPVES